MLALLTAVLSVVCLLLPLQDGKSFLLIPAWSNNSTELLSVTLASGPCQDVAAARAAARSSSNLQAAHG